MKRIITLILFLFTLMFSQAQTEGISYQAVIIGPDDLELPGVDSEGNYLPTTDIIVRFSIIAPGSGIVEFTEEQDTTTDEFGRINLIIGQGNYDDFEKIYWGGNPKSLKVEIDFRDGNGFMDLSVEKLTYVPYVQHRTIKASDSLIVDGNTELRGDLTVVNQPTNLGGTFNVNAGNRSNLSGDLNVDGVTNLNNEFNVNNKSVTNLSGALIVGDTLTGPPDFDIDAPTVLGGSLEVKGKSTFGALESKTLIVSESTDLGGSLNVDATEQIVLRSTVHTEEPEYDIGADDVRRLTDPDNDPGKNIGNYAVLVEGSTQGIAVKVKADRGRGNGNNFVSFWDTSDGEGSNIMWGRIEGERESEFENNADYVFDQNSLGYDIYDANLDLAWATIDIVIEGFDLAAAYTDFRPCLGFGACTTGPGPADIAASVASVALVITKEVFAIRGKVIADSNRETYDNNKVEFQGVTYASGAGDYAEYLLRENLNETLSFADIVGVKGGKISKNTEGAEKVMVISRKPIVLGNMPTSGNEANYEKVAFMGQVPVKVYGRVNIGDYIVASGKHDGIGIAVKPSNISTRLIKKIVGIAWEESNSSSGFDMINVAVGLNNNDNNPIVEKLEKKMSDQQLMIDILKAQMASILKRFDSLEQNTPVNTNSTVNTNIKDSENEHYDDRKYEIMDSPLGEVVYFEMTDEDFEQGLKMAETQLIAEGIDLSENEFWKNLNNNPLFKSTLKDKLKSKFHKQLHYHKKASKIMGHK